MRELFIKIQRDEASGDWSIEINGRFYEYISAEVMEELVIVAVIEAERVLTEPTSQRVH